MKGSEKKSQKDQEKADHLEATNIEDYHNPVSAPEGKENLSDKEVQDKLNVYSHATGSWERYVKIQLLKAKYKGKMDKLNDNRIKQDIHFGAGERLGLPQSHHEAIKNDRDWMDQKARDEVIKEGKEEYDEEGLKKTFSAEIKELGKRHDFNHAHNQHRNKDIDMDR